MGSHMVKTRNQKIIVKEDNLISVNPFEGAEVSPAYAFAYAA